VGRSSGTWLLRIAILVVVIVGGFLAWQALKPEGLPEGIAGSNGRIEATEIGIAAETTQANEQMANAA
jgi:HlyD family secretion protein